MIFSPAPALLEARLPQLSGRWVSAYRLAWCLLALAATGLLAASVIEPAGHPAIVALRLVKGAVVIAVSAILLRRRARDPVAALLSLAFLTWTITSSFNFASAELLPMLLDRLRFLLFVLALLLFPDGSWRPGWTRAVALASCAVFLLGLAEGGGALPTRLFLPLAIGCVIAALVSLFSRFRTAESEAVRQQLKWVALGLVAGIGLILSARAGAAINAASPLLRPLPVLWEAMFQVGIVIIALGFLVSLLRYRLFDAETAISRSAAFAVLTVMVVAVFAGTEATIENLGQTYLGMGIGNISAAMGAAVAAVLLNPLHERISGWAERRFQRDLVLLKRELPELVEDIAATSSPAQLAGAMLPPICEAIHAVRGALVVNGAIIGSEGIDRSAARRWARLHLAQPDGEADDTIFPLRLPLGGGGWLLLGPRPDGSLYGREDLDALHHVLPTLRRALAAAIAREELRAAGRRERRKLDRQVEQLRGEVAALEARLNQRVLSAA